MKNRKKLAALVLTIALLFCACGEKPVEDLPEYSLEDATSIVVSEAPNSEEETSVPSVPPVSPVSSEETASVNTVKLSSNWVALEQDFYSSDYPFDVSKLPLLSSPEEKLHIDPKMVYPIYASCTHSREEMETFANETNHGTRISEQLKINQSPQYGVAVRRADGSLYGVCYIAQEDDQWTVTQMMEGGTSGELLTITEPLAKALSDLEYYPGKTAAKSVMIPGYARGILFSDETGESFYLTQDSRTISGVMAVGSFYSPKFIARDMIARLDELYPAQKKANSDEVRENPDTGKPVIYLYPKQKQRTTVKLDYSGEFTYTYPTYHDGWTVDAYPDGRLINVADNTEHFYLFWEGNKKIPWNFDEGFVVEGKDCEAFLREKLSFMGLTPREYNDFLVYWVPELMQNEYNLITFAHEQYETLAPMIVTPKPDSILRVHMVYKAIPKPIDIPEQTLIPFERKGFIVVEWGGTRG